MDKACAECGAPAARLRKGRCDACYMRQYRHGEPARGDRCAACGERRLPVLELVKLGGVEAVLCGNCAVVLARARPRIESIEELRRRLERRHVPERRESFIERTSTPVWTPVVPTFDPTTD